MSHVQYILHGIKWSGREKKEYIHIGYLKVALKYTFLKHILLLAFCCNVRTGSKKMQQSTHVLKYQKGALDMKKI